MSSKSQGKRRNGKGESISVFFDDSDPTEAAALKMAQLLATKHGRRKSAIIAMLAAMQKHFEQTGELLNSTDIANAITGTATLNLQPTGFTPAVSNQRGLQPQPAQGYTPPSASSDLTPEQRQSGRHYADDTPGVVVTAGGKASAKTVADNFLKNIGSAFFD